MNWSWVLKRVATFFRGQCRERRVNFFSHVSDAHPLVIVSFSCSKSFKFLKAWLVSEFLLSDLFRICGQAIAFTLGRGTDYLCLWWFLVDRGTTVWKFPLAFPPTRFSLFPSPQSNKQRAKNFRWMVTANRKKPWFYHIGSVCWQAHYRFDGIRSVQSGR